MKTKYTIFTLLVMCFLFSLVSLSFGQDMTFEEKQKAKADYDQTYGDIKSNHNYYPFSPDIQLTEDFESGTWPPVGWTEYHTGIDALDESTAQSYSPTHSAFFDDISGVDSSWFVTPQIIALEASANVTFSNLFISYLRWLITSRSTSTGHTARLCSWHSHAAN